ncbi:MAG: site-2 protease family protein [Bacteroidales bacterium]
MADPFFPRRPAEPPDGAQGLAASQDVGGVPPVGDHRPSAFDPSSYPRSEYQPVWIAAAPVRNRLWMHWLLFAITIGTTTWVGIDHWVGFRADFSQIRAILIVRHFGLAALLVRGLWYSATILLILGAHELGHYFACKHYRIDASPPYFLPLPPPFPMTGTLGAFIRIRQPITTKRALFDIGVAGPLAGFVFVVPALFVGMALSHIARVPPPRPDVIELGEPLLFKFTSWLVFGTIPEGYTVNLHPMAFAAWFGLLATALNLLPIGQLDGGHISYAVLGRRSTLVTYLGLAGLVLLNVVLGIVYGSPALALFTLLIVVMLFVFGPRHPPVLDEHIELDHTRVAIAVFALAILILSFSPVPFRGL